MHYIDGESCPVEEDVQQVPALGFEAPGIRSRWLHLVFGLLELVGVFKRPVRILYGPFEFTL
jgi:hypothetical protein